MTGLDDLRADSRSIAELIEAQLALDGGRAQFGAPPVAVLHARGTREVLEVARELCSSRDARRRALAASILGQLGAPSRTFPEECCDALLALSRDREENVRIASVFALGHLGNRRADAALVDLRNDPSADIRHGVAFALVGARSPDAVATLLALMEDSHPLARDWATTAISRPPEIDGPDIRAALLKRATDEDALTRMEALHGLARRGDERAITFLIDELRSTDAPDGAIEAALEMLGLDAASAPSDDWGVDRDALIDLLRGRARRG